MKDILLRNISQTNGLIFDKIVFKEKNEPVNFDKKSQVGIDKIKKIKRTIDLLGTKEKTYGDKIQIKKTKEKEYEFMTYLTQQEISKFKLKKKLYELINPLDEEDERIREIMLNSKMKNLNENKNFKNIPNNLQLSKIKTTSGINSNSNRNLNNYSSNTRNFKKPSTSQSNRSQMSLSKSKTVLSYRSYGSQNTLNFNKKGYLFSASLLNGYKKLNNNPHDHNNSQISPISPNCKMNLKNPNIFSDNLDSPIIKINSKFYREQVFFNSPIKIINNKNNQNLKNSDLEDSESQFKIHSELQSEIELESPNKIDSIIKLNSMKRIPQSAKKSLVSLNSIRKDVINSINDWTKDSDFSKNLKERRDTRNYSATRASTAHTRFFSTNC